jgi:hypothetical protein
MERGQRIRCEHQDDGAGSQCIIWAQLSMANPPRWARWLYAALAGLVVARGHTSRRAGAACSAWRTPQCRRDPCAPCRHLHAAAPPRYRQHHVHPQGAFTSSQLVGMAPIPARGLLFLPAGAYSACVQLVPSLASGGGYGSALAAAFVALASGVLGLLGSMVIGWETLLDTIRDLAQQGRDGREL